MRPWRWVLTGLAICLLFLSAPVSAAGPATVSIDPALEKEWLFVGEQVELKAEVSPESAAADLEWTVSDPKVFQLLRKDGKTFLVVKSMGQATVTAQVGKSVDRVRLHAFDWVFACSLLLVIVVVLAFIVIIALDARGKSPPFFPKKQK